MRAWRKFISAGGLKPIMLCAVEVSAGYSSLRALFGVSLEVAAGETVGVIGPNGAGKTTLMQVISGLVAAFAGAITLDGRSIVGVPPHRIVEHGIAHVPENRRLFPRFSVEDNLRIGAFIPAARHHFVQHPALIDQLFPRRGGGRGKPAGTLSGGEQQMCAIGRALMSRPRLLLMDEPSAGLAPLVVQHSVRSDPPHSRGRAHGPHRGAERPAGARGGRPRLSPRGRQHSPGGHLDRAEKQRIHPQGLYGVVAGMDMFLLEAAINGRLLAGVLALLTLGLNLIFGVIDVVWIAYADLVMCGMYAVYWLFAVYGWPLPLAFAVSVLGVAALGMMVHVLIIAPILSSAPINQLLATGGLLYFLQSFATLLFTTDFRNIGVRL